jgi:putative ABC transport system substrate-binding protein
MNRPGGNLTGVNILTTELEAKRLELLREVAPGASLIGFLVNPAFPDSQRQVKEGETAARTLGRQIAIANASTEAEIDAAYAHLVQQRVGAMLIGSDPYLSTRRDKLVALAAQHALPAIYQWREFVAAGGLMSYGTNLVEPYRQVARYVGRILKGEKPADLPVVQLAKVELVINMKTAKTLGLTFPLTLLGRADEVIE